jgi:hypothetical protein
MSLPTPLATVIGEREASEPIDRGFILLLLLLLFSVLSGVAVIGRLVRFVWTECLPNDPVCKDRHWNPLGLGFEVKTTHNLARQLRSIPSRSGHLIFLPFVRIALAIGLIARYIFIAVDAVFSIISISFTTSKPGCRFRFFAFVI